MSYDELLRAGKPDHERLRELSAEELLAVHAQLGRDFHRLGYSRERELLSVAVWGHYGRLRPNDPRVVRDRAAWDRDTRS